MSAMEQWLRAGTRQLRRARWLVLAMALWTAASSSALAKKKKDEPVAAPTKSYTVSYFLVILALTGGMMAVLRPSSRLDKVPEKIRPDDDE